MVSKTHANKSLFSEVQPHHIPCIVLTANIVAPGSTELSFAQFPHIQAVWRNHAANAERHVQEIVQRCLERVEIAAAAKI